MLRRLILIFTVAALLLTCGISHAAIGKKKNYTGPLLRNCTVYQLGEDEILLKLSGRNIPLPDSFTQNNLLYIKLESTKTYHPDKINSSLRSTAESIPILYEITAENVSDDKSFGTLITLKSNKPLKVHSQNMTHDGCSMRLRFDAEDNGMTLGSTYVPPPKNIPSPQSSVPFRVGTRITLELRDAELRDVLRGIMAYIGRNIIIDPTFPNDVLITMTLNDIRADEVLNYFMRTYDLACYTSGVNTLTFGTREGLYKLSGEREIKSFKINFADPAQVSTMLKTLAALEDNAVTVDDRLKTVHVKTNPAKMEEVEELIGILDAPQKQVMIRASIFEFTENDTVAVENALQVLYDDIQLSLGGTTGLIVGYRNDRSIRGSREVWNQRVITDTLTALEQKTHGKVIANPSVIALDGKQAEITLTQDYPYISDRDNQKGTVTWSTEEVGPKLTFTPRVGKDGLITLTLDISTGDVIGTQSSSTGDTMPVTTTRSVKTEVRVRDGMPFVIGGLFREDKTKSVSKIPILGNIPLLGELFTSRSNLNVKSQVVMIITPYVLDTK